MDEIAETTTNAAFARIQATAGLAEIGNGAEFAVDGSGSVPPAIELVAGFLGRLFVLEAGVDVADEIFELDIVSMLFLRMQGQYTFGVFLFLLT